MNKHAGFYGEISKRLGKYTELRDEAYKEWDISRDKEDAIRFGMYAAIASELNDILISEMQSERCIPDSIVREYVQETFFKGGN